MQTNTGFDPAGNRTTYAVAGSPVPPALSINSVSAVEGNLLVFTVTRTGSASISVSVNYATSDGSAASPARYEAASGTVMFLPSDTTKTISVATVDDTVVQGNQTFSLSLSGASAGSSITTGVGTGTIIDNDAAPSFAITNTPSANEGGSLAFTVTRTGASTGTYTVNYATANGSAVAGANYTATSGTLSFTTNGSSQIVTVPTIDDHAATANLSMSLALSAPSGGSTIATGSAIGTITNIDAANQPPTTVNDTLTVNRCATATVNVVANDTDPEGNYPLVVLSVSRGTKGSASVSGTTSIQYTANTVAGYDPITYTVRDSLGATSTGILGVTVTKKALCQ